MRLVPNVVKNNLKLVLIGVLGLATHLKTPIAEVVTNAASWDAFTRNVLGSVGETAFHAPNLANGNVSTWANVICRVGHRVIDFPVMTVVLNFSSVGTVALLCAAKSALRPTFVRHAGQ